MTSLERVSTIRGNEKEKTIASQNITSVRIRMGDAAACMNVKGPKKILEQTLYNKKRPKTRKTMPWWHNQAH